ncbi:MAG: hypothetical protein LBL72_11915 [Candidatus Accumulibacter sp.]|jgi:hypothetical protein|nr:hypothetical protein [Accumulibacter sp.]
METVGVRFPVSDIEWLASLSMKDALTPSDKIRAIVAEARQRNEGSGDYDTELFWLRDLLAPATALINGREFRSGMHSELVSLVVEWVPQTLALIFSLGTQGYEDAAGDADALEKLEAQLAQCAFQLCEALLRLGVGSSAPCYDPGIIRSRLPRIVELVEVVSTPPNRG